MLEKHTSLVAIARDETTIRIRDSGMATITITIDTKDVKAPEARIRPGVGQIEIGTGTATAVTGSKVSHGGRGMFRN